MICLKCGNEIKDNEQICGNCGWNKNNIVSNDAFATVNRGVYNPNAVDKDVAGKVLEEQKQFDELLQIYIGKMFYNFKKGGFSFCAFFLGPIYFLYRKLYGVGAIIWILNFILSFIFTRNMDMSFIADNYQNQEVLKLLFMKNAHVSIVYPIITLGLSVFYGLIFKKFYFRECVERVAKIKNENPNMGFNQLCELVRHKGGVNKVVGIIFGVLIGGMLALMLLSLIIVLLMLI